MVKYRGCDVSKWNGVIDFAEVKADGVDFLMIREAYGKKDPKQIDKRFKENYTGAKAVGIPVGVYHYSYADSVSDAKAEAEFCLENIQGMKLEYPVVFDIEDKEQLKLNNRQRTDIVKAFCETIENAGYYAMIYTNLNWLKNYLYSEELLSKYDWWLAQWNVGEPSVECGIWQYSDRGTIYGINGNVDLNISYKNYPEIMIKKGLNGFSKQDTIQVPPKENHYIYTVVSGDTLWDISEKYLGSGLKYKDIMELNELKSDKIYVGQKIKLPI